MTKNLKLTGWKWKTSAILRQNIHAAPQCNLTNFWPFSAMWHARFAIFVFLLAQFIFLMLNSRHIINQLLSWPIAFCVWCQTGKGKGFIGQEPLTKVVRGSEASNLHVLLIVRPALQNRGYSLETEKKGRRVGGKKGKTETRERTGWEGGKGGGGVGEEGKMREKEGFI